MTGATPLGQGLAGLGEGPYGALALLHETLSTMKLLKLEHMRGLLHVQAQTRVTPR